MIKKFFIALIACSPLMAFSQTQIINSWSDPNAGNQIHKLLVAAQVYDEGARRNIEDYLVSLYPNISTQSYKILGDAPLASEASQSRQLRNMGFDGVLILSHTGNNDQQQYVSGRPSTNYTTWTGYRSFWGPHPVNHWIPGTPGRVQNTYTWFVQVQLFALSSDKLIYSANTSTTKPGGTVPLFDDVSNAIHGQLSSNGILP